jgi:hypothetical protein
MGGIDHLPVEPGAINVMDRGYVDFRRLRGSPTKVCSSSYAPGLTFASTRSWYQGSRPQLPAARASLRLARPIHRQQSADTGLRRTEQAARRRRASQRQEWRGEPGRFKRDDVCFGRAKRAGSGSMA